MQKRAQDHRSARRPSRPGERGSRQRPLPAPAARRRPAMRQDPRCGGHRLRSHPPRGPVRRSTAPVLSPPPFALTLRAMQGMRQRLGLRRARLAVLLSVSALLAFAWCIPSFAQAADAPGIEYSSAPPTATGLTPAHPKSTAHSPTGNGGASAQTSDGQANPAGSGAGPSNGNPSSTDKAGSKGSGEGSGQGSPGNGHKDKQAGKNQTDQKAAGSTTSSSSDDDDSSPLIPILAIAAALAAISVGVVMMRQRRQRRGPGSPVSSKAS